ncbi:MAG: hypothetical protein OEL77_05260 [Nitrosopumilus sp.]|nr:hypothetical protein [Nitrosopumilus sp.]MDH3385402.1 hypothetical protein [Nitrosopumilus sp.]
MSGIDELISNSLTNVIKKNLESNIEKKVKLSLFKKYGMSLNPAINDFSIVDEVLNEFLKTDTLSFEKKCLVEIFTLKKLKDSYLVTIKDESLVNLIVEILGDKEYRMIIESTLFKPLLITEIIDVCKLPKTSAYRKINYLLRNGFLTGAGKEFTAKRRSVEKLSTIFQKINFELDKNQKVIKLVVFESIIKHSSTIKVILGL